MFVTITDTKPKYLMSLNPTPYSLLPKPQRYLAILLIFGIRMYEINYTECLLVGIPDVSVL
ncbi:MAG: hypothetical protein F6K24_23585 [Okeania sp. SIO2D1]|uniref:hypothetical protein n=1 Tax=Okeania sp. SIO2C9 TaxID=2607791 RepID=UPI0013B6D6DD|nr:hypothetical protein [Okeania sp. SIO2C9]NEQ73954.1 hypothetical protein [Okeania sp. SIO2C9]NES68011.1 hypothetical protein [Okeania sp. SIO2D1]